MTTQKISATEVSKHCSEDNAWVVVNGIVWDMTGFPSKHPGGAEIIRTYFGGDGSEAYNAIHGPGLIGEHLGPGKRIGELDDASLKESIKIKKKESGPPQPDINSIINLSEFESLAEERMADRTWGYVSGATEDGVSHRANLDWYRRIFLRPRVLSKVETVDMSVKCLGQNYDLPFFNAPTSSVKLSHPDGEIALAKAAVAFGVPAIIPTMGSYSAQEIFDVLPPGHPFFFQLYMYTDRAEAEKLLLSVCRLKPRAILFTVDLPVMSKREVPPRRRNASEAGNKREIALPPTNTAIDENIGWEDIAWIRDRTKVPIFLKGIQCAADARRAYDYGCAGIYLSNHGGRAMDTAVPAILVLLEIHATCPEILDKMEIFVDGGIRRGSDILKALCLGASIVGVGRPFLYALASGGEEGARRAFKILRDELQTAMQLVGITSLDQAHPGLLNTTDIDKYVYVGDAHPWARKVDRSKL